MFPFTSVDMFLSSRVGKNITKTPFWQLSRPLEPHRDGRTAEVKIIVETLENADLTAFSGVIFMFRIGM